MTCFSHVHKYNQRIYKPNGTFSDVVTFHFPANSLLLSDIDQYNPRVKLKDIAHLRYVKALARGENSPLIVAFNRLEQDRPVKTIFPDTSYTTSAGEVLLSANSFITHTMRKLLEQGWLHYRAGNWLVDAPTKVWQQKGNAVISLLTTQNRLYLESGPTTKASTRIDFAKFDAYQNLIPISRCGFISDVVAQQRPHLVFNTAFFLLEHEDFLSHHSAIGEAFNLWVSDGIIYRPPLYRRGTIFQRRDRRWEVALFGMEDLSITLPNNMQLTHRDVARDGNSIPFTLNEEDSSEVIIYTRYYGINDHKHVLGHTPASTGRFELTVIDRRIVSWQIGGGVALPQNGFVISIAPEAFPSATLRELQRILLSNFLISYHFVKPDHQHIVQAIQNGPILLQNKRSPLTDTYLETVEQFWCSRFLDNNIWQIGIVPTDYATDIARSHHGRVGLGIDKNGDLVLVMVAGVNQGMGVPGADSNGATLLQLTDLLREAGAINAINLDGGGSTQAYYLGGQALVPGDRRGLPQVHYERMIPSVGLVF